ncbi:hypothetical protein [Cellulosispirillum alkaliphilum]|uniref:hypothetical protein n=1 Tax=Cellulosispirillum alkaliphilum TaxID=3039283 RepID=UPI003D6DACC7
MSLGTFKGWLGRYKNESSKTTNNEAFIKLAPNIQQNQTHLQYPATSELTIDLNSGARIVWRGTEISTSVYRLIADLNKGCVT